MRKTLILIAFGAILAGCSKQNGAQNASTASSTTNSSSKYSAPAPAPNAAAARGETAPPADTPKPIDTSTHY